MWHCPSRALSWVVAAAYFYTLIAGGEAISERFGSLFEEDPATVYYENRGNQVEFGFAEQLPHYPFGAGLGRYGMINYYFGDPGSLNAPQIWVEIQWNAWVIDGGFILLLLYPIAIFVSFHEQIKIAFTHPDQEVRELACIVVAINSAAPRSVSVTSFSCLLEAFNSGSYREPSILWLITPGHRANSRKLRRFFSIHKPL